MMQSLEIIHFYTARQPLPKKLYKNYTKRIDTTITQNNTKQKMYIKFLHNKKCTNCNLYKSQTKNVLKLEI